MGNVEALPNAKRLFGGVGVSHLSGDVRKSSTGAGFATHTAGRESSGIHQAPPNRKIEGYSVAEVQEIWDLNKGALIKLCDVILENVKLREALQDERRKRKELEIAYKRAWT